MTAEGPTEALPSPVPFFLVFFLPNIWGILFAAGFEYIQVETKLSNLFRGHPFALFGLGIFVLANTASYLSGCVVCARLEYNVKLPNLYADKKENKNAVLFNCIQRGHQNLVENYAHYVRCLVKGICDSECDHIRSFKVPIANIDFPSHLSVRTGHVGFLYGSGCRSPQRGWGLTNCSIDVSLLVCGWVQEPRHYPKISTLFVFHVCEFRRRRLCLFGGFEHAEPGAICSRTIGIVKCLSQECYELYC